PHTHPPPTHRLPLSLHDALPIFDAHLMVTHPQHFVAAFAEAGVDDLTVHVESDHDIRSTIRAIRDAGVKPGLVLNPATPFDRARSEEHTSELQSRGHLVCRPLLE